jgi:hypothetical protein
MSYFYKGNSISSIIQSGGSTSPTITTYYANFPPIVTPSYTLQNLGTAGSTLSYQITGTDIANQIAATSTKFNSGSNISVPNWANKMSAVLVSGGGGGGGAGRNDNGYGRNGRPGGGGGAGAFIASNIINFNDYGINATNYSILVGTGGAGGPGSINGENQVPGSTGNPGGVSQIDWGNLTLSVNGGAGGGGGATQSGNSGSPGAGGNGGNVVGGYVNLAYYADGIDGTPGQQNNNTGPGGTGGSVPNLSNYNNAVYGPPIGSLGGGSSNLEDSGSTGGFAGYSLNNYPNIEVYANYYSGGGGGASSVNSNNNAFDGAPGGVGAPGFVQVWFYF